MEDTSRAALRLQNTLNHLKIESNEPSIEISNCSASDKGKPLKKWLNDSPRDAHHQGKEPFKWNGWGYEGNGFVLNERGQVYLQGDKYSMSNVSFPKFRPWAEALLGLDINYQHPAQERHPPLPEPIKNHEFLQAIEKNFDKISFEDKDRVFHAHGHTCEDIWKLRYGHFERAPDVVIWPGNHDHVVTIVKAAHQFNVVIIPFGGGTSVTSALDCPENERRMIVSLDMHEMNRIKWIDYESMMACIECGVVGKDLDAKLAKLGLCMGHEPDSNEFSTLGGWIATRASGMKKNVYGNIEDILVSAKMVTPTGILEKQSNWPRVSTGPDMHEIMMGSEGTMGVITEATVKLRPLPEVQAYGSIVFPDFESGLACLREIARQKCAPASIRLMDNLQFQFGQMLKPEDHSFTGEWIDAAKKWYVTSFKGFSVEKMVAATLLFEGNSAEVSLQQKRVYAIAAKFHGLQGGEENGRRGYFLTYMIAYIRDFGFQYSFMAESFETSVPWSQVGQLCQNVKDRIRLSCKEKGVKFPPFVTCRVTQTYDVGAAVYFYFGFIYRDLENPLKAYIEIESEARDEIIKNGGSLSHHHGVGKLRKKWMEQTISPTGIKVLKSVKESVDPKNIFANGNLV
eukprot:TRINITY_DN3310_c0_g1_i2.p1 TRINITY_DN3310_c0_g1~~TRINITY_DN3310_c0_g1_i2.p1  ORF type:complete len:640 (+),score=144.28 TRINITY_DN3310_c0_g1_i2:43-1920(+)